MKKNIEYLIGKECAKGNTVQSIQTTSLVCSMLPFKDAAFGTYQYDDFMSTLKKYAKKLDCPIEELHAQENELVYDIEL